jgi:hypothetical protein
MNDLEQFPFIQAESSASANYEGQEFECRSYNFETQLISICLWL